MMKYSVYTWDLVQALDSASPASCKTLVTFIDSIAQTTNQKKKRTQKCNSSPNKSYYTALSYVHRTQG